MEEMEKALDSDGDTAVPPPVKSELVVKDEPDGTAAADEEPTAAGAQPSTIAKEEDADGEDEADGRDDELDKKRKERLRAWQEIQKKAAAAKEESEARERATRAVVAMGLTGGKTAPKMSLGGGKGKSKLGKAPVVKAAWQDDELDDDEEEEEHDDAFYSLDKQGRPVPREPPGNADAPASPPPPLPPLAPLSPEVKVEENGGAGYKADEEEEDYEDPLDAFMNTLRASDVLVEQEDDSISNSVGDGAAAAAGGSNGAPRRPVLDVYGTNTISLEDIMRGNSRGKMESWESDVPMSDMEHHSDEEDDQASVIDEEEEERQRQEFMEAWRKQQEEQEAEAIRQEEEKKRLQEEEEEREERERKLGRLWASEGDIMEEGERTEQKDALTLLAEQLKKKELKAVDHSTIEYIPIRKNLYIVPKVLAALTAEEVNAARNALEIKIRGKGCPPLIDTWVQCGLSERVLNVIQKCGFEAPFAIQRQAVPAMMSGRDVIGVARTGSGKTLAFLLPMLRHILDQPKLGEGEGPIGLIMAPARELAVQIHAEARRFTRPLGLNVTAVYGGAGVADQIADLKRGADIVVCTPGRMIDILTMQAGKLVSLSRVSFVVMDEADRMFDMGFEPQIQMILKNIRPDRQTALFSATFPQKVEALARKALQMPLEIIVGGRSVASEAITQHVEVREEDDKYMRLLQLLGVWYERGNVLVFVDTQAKADSLFQDLTKSGYPALSLHGGKDQTDRESTISDFKAKVRTLMIATSVAGRGLDVPELVCVINYSCPNHLEDYVHRVGRTGRAGRTGTAYTFISPEEDQHAPTLIKALQASNQIVPPELQEMADAFAAKVAGGMAHKANSGFSGRGFTFDDEEMNESQKIRSQEKRQYEIEQGLRETGDTKEEQEAERRMGEDDSDNPILAIPTPGLPGLISTMPITMSTTPTPTMYGSPSPPLDPVAAAAELAARVRAEQAMNADPALAAARAAAAQQAASMGLIQAPGMNAPAAPPQPIMSQAEMLRQAKMIAQGLGKGPPPPGLTANGYFQSIVEINDHPQQARWKVTQKESLSQVIELTGVNIITRGIYIPKGKIPGPGEEKLHLRIEAPQEQQVANAKKEIMRILNEETLKSAGHQSYGKYQVV